jgi:hypothetical protein
VLEKCINNDHLCACGSPPCPTEITDDAVIDDIEEFYDEDHNEYDHDSIKEFDYDDLIENNQSSSPSAEIQAQVECYYIPKKTLL